MTWRGPDELLERVRAQAREHGRSLNEWVTLVLDAASDPSTAGTDAERLRERLARAGLLETAATQMTRRPTTRQVAEARAAAGRGTSLADIVAADRR